MPVSNKYVPDTPRPNALKWGTHAGGLSEINLTSVVQFVPRKISSLSVTQASSSVATLIDALEIQRRERPVNVVNEAAVTQLLKDLVQNFPDHARKWTLSTYRKHLLTRSSVIRKWFPKMRSLDDPAWVDAAWDRGDNLAYVNLSVSSPGADLFKVPPGELDINKLDSGFYSPLEGLRYILEWLCTAESLPRDLTRVTARSALKHALQFLSNQRLKQALNRRTKETPLYSFTFQEVDYSVVRLDTQEQFFDEHVANRVCLDSPRYFACAMHGRRQYLSVRETETGRGRLTIELAVSVTTGETHPHEVSSTGNLNLAKRLPLVEKVAKVLEMPGLVMIYMRNMR